MEHSRFASRKGRKVAPLGRLRSDFVTESRQVIVTIGTYDRLVGFGGARINMESEDKRKPYSRPTFTKLTPEQAKKLVADRNNCNEEEAADFFRSLRKQPSDATDQKRKRSA
jgi:hypothetical protein